MSTLKSYIVVFIFIIKIDLIEYFIRGSSGNDKIVLSE